MSSGAAGADAPFFAQTLRDLEPLDTQNAKALLRDLLARASEKECAGVGTLTASKPAAAFVAAVLDLSPYLRAILLRRPQIIEPLFEMPLSKRLEALMLEIAATSEGDDVTEAGLMTALRQAKLKGHVLIALGDLSGQFTTLGDDAVALPTCRRMSWRRGAFPAA